MDKDSKIIQNFNKKIIDYVKKIDDGNNEFSLENLFKCIINNIDITTIGFLKCIHEHINDFDEDDFRTAENLYYLNVFKNILKSSLIE